MPTRPNILWICTEHQRFDTIHSLGNEHIRTPNLDRLVAEGTAFTHAFCQNSVCTPSRSSFLTGRYPVTTRCRQNGQNLPDDEVLITRVLHDEGYDCGLAGKLHVSAAFHGSERRVDDGYRMFEWSHGSTAAHGGDWVTWLGKNGKTFDDVYKRSPVIFAREVTERKYHQTTWCFDQALSFLTEEREGPWLMSINPFSAHDPFDLLPEFYDNYDPDALPPPLWRDGELDAKPPFQRAAYEKRGGPKGYAGTTERQRCEMKAAYYATIEHIDAEIGRLLDWLDQTGQGENTLIIFTADHGDMGGDHGIFQKGPYLYDPAVRVPLIFSWPGTIPAGRVYDGLVELVDIVPTIHELLGMDIPQRVQGRSLVSLFGEGIPEPAFRDGVYSEYYNANPAKTSPQRKRAYLTMWRTDSYKVVVYHGEEFGELYDLARDPNEFDNRWDDPEYRQIRADMLKACFDKAVFTMDPMPPRVSGF
ncbi:MAG: sulfatase-like hydrolase/transferase [Lentisphaerae bacterium]|jgi:arylsulfatase|nr:sulfatase-like hydrolase/transferase [Lentisphaerota bacterium]MBT4822488.1 sulfatase-like hydrolase/transferase [Lentisphaerota bacterium]MBT5612801.1 sulfatase-like hydrolase/transferase [Lentisphaerota bacterium]MBT7057627.1 sulfatase-like hydrolase/transferase [Lentisphaerota bacterium]MBT7844926.1 sulfatase-like hydrolase/transferase [Lentisphaerota bacterium]